MNDNMANDPARADKIILVDAFDHEIGTATKEEAHRRSLLHRAFSVVLVREGESGLEMLISRRAEGKYHSAGLWANSCCSHPRAGEDVLEAATRRVPEELGVEVEGLEEIAAFMYRAVFESGICEYEYDHVLVGRCIGEPEPDPSEVSETRWIGFEELSRELVQKPASFAPWALTVFPLVIGHIHSPK